MKTTKSGVSGIAAAVLALSACQGGEAISTAQAAGSASTSASSNAASTNESAVSTAPPAGAKGKRKAPADVAPVKIGKISYEVVHWGRMRDLPQNGGYLAAKDASGKELWIQQIYSNKVDARMESDVQDVFITSLKLGADGKTLEIQNERGEKYRFDPQSKKLLP